MANTPAAITQAMLPLETDSQTDIFRCTLNLQADWWNWAQVPDVPCIFKDVATHSLRGSYSPFTWIATSLVWSRQNIVVMGNGEGDGSTDECP